MTDLDASNAEELRGVLTESATQIEVSFEIDGNPATATFRIDDDSHLFKESLDKRPDGSFFEKPPLRWQGMLESMLETGAAEFVPVDEEVDA